MKLHLYLLSIALSITGFLFTAHVNAQVYKCISVDDVTRQSKVVYTDSPCHQAQKQTLTAIQTKSSPLSAQAIQAAQLAQASAVDSAVTRAVLNQDFKLAKSLAVTKEHWRLITIAEGEATPQPVIVATNQAVFSPEDECAQAKDNFEFVSRTSWRDKDLVAAKKSVMYVTCGVPEPAVNRPIFVGQAYGSLNTGHWRPHNYVPHQARHYDGIGHHAYPLAHHTHYGRSHAWGGASLSYKSKHFGINFNSTNVR
jgi:hypothetical protein